MSVINNRYDNLKKIYSSLIENGFLEEGDIINYDDIITEPLESEIHELTKSLNYKLSLLT